MEKIIERRRNEISNRSNRVVIFPSSFEIFSSVSVNWQPEASRVEGKKRIVRVKTNQNQSVSESERVWKSRKVQQRKVSKCSSSVGS